MKINVAVVGVGNCAKSLVETVAFYSGRTNYSGLRHPQIGSFSVPDINFVAAFDVDQRKVGKRLHDAINSERNVADQLAKPLEYDAMVQRGPTHDSITDQLRDQGFILESVENPVDVVQVLRESRAHIVLNYLPTGSDQAARAYADASLDAGCSFINCMPTHLAKDTDLNSRFHEEGLVLLGDDIKSQVGATYLTRWLIEGIQSRGAVVTSVQQTNYGGGGDHCNLQSRGGAKEKSKQDALTGVLTSVVPVVGMIYMQEFGDHKEARIRIEATIAGGAPITIDTTLEDEDSPNSAGVVVDAIRYARALTLQEKQGRANDVSALLMKSPHLESQVPELEALNLERELLRNLAND